MISLEQAPRDFGAERRRLRVVKMRGVKFRGGFHDFILDTGGLAVFPRLVAAEHHATSGDAASTGIAELDALLGGGLARGTNTLLTGPSGVGKTTTAISCVLAALQRGERATYYLFDEGLGTLLARASALGMDLQPLPRHRPADAHADRSGRAFAGRVRQRGSARPWRGRLDASS